MPRTPSPFTQIRKFGEANHTNLSGFLREEKRQGLPDAFSLNYKFHTISASPFSCIRIIATDFS